MEDDDIEELKGVLLIMEKKLLFGDRIDRYFDEMKEDLKKLVSIPSVCDTDSDVKPFGQPCRDALDYILMRARDFGLITSVTDYYAGDARYGDGDEYADILTHLDVVPAGSGWDTAPFEAVEKGGKLFGRGTADDKGAAVAALYALRALKDADVKGRRCLRAVFGCGEEIGSEDLTVYYEKNGYPAAGFTPDCSYGICNSEKGILRIHLEAPHKEEQNILSFQAGTAVNAVPSEAQAWIRYTEEAWTKIQEIIRNKESGLTAELTQEVPEGTGLESAIHLFQRGKAAHGAEPELGVNAASLLLQVLKEVLGADKIGTLPAFAADRIGMEYNGQSLGIRKSDEPSGDLTLNLGIVSIGKEKDQMDLDIRYPVTAQKDPIMTGIRQAASQYGVAVSEANHMAPLYVPEDSAQIRILSEAYEAVTGEKCDIFSTGGGTYARHADNKVVAFGPVFSDQEPTNAHGPNEFLDLERFREHCRICLEAAYRLLIME